MAIKRTVAPTEDPVTLAEIKDHLREDGDGQDQWIAAAIVAATEQAEQFTRRQFVDATFTLILDKFPQGHPHTIELPKPPADSVTSITYVDVNGTTQTLAASRYQTDFISEPARVKPAFSDVWPATRSVFNAVTVTYIAGYGAASAVPEGVKSAIKLLIANWYENREPVITGTIATKMPMSVEALLDQFHAYGQEFA